MSTAEARHFAPVSLAHAAFACRCPRCGEGRLFTGLLSVCPSCPACGLDLSAQDAGDGPAVFVIFFLGLIVVGLAAIVATVWWAPTPYNPYLDLAPVVPGPEGLLAIGLLAVPALAASLSRVDHAPYQA